MELQIRTEPNDHGGTDYIVDGDEGFYWWLINTAGTARDGFRGSYAGASDQSGDRLVLEPRHPLPDADQNWRSPTARNRLEPTPRPRPKITLTTRAAEALGADELGKLREQGDVVVEDPAQPLPADPGVTGTTPDRTNV